MTICGGQRDAPGDIIPKTNFRRDAGPSTALAGYAASPGLRETLDYLQIVVVACEVHPAATRYWRAINLQKLVHDDFFQFGREGADIAAKNTSVGKTGGHSVRTDNVQPHAVERAVCPRPIVLGVK
jgi:hypothetical protein